MPHFRYDLEAAFCKLDLVLIIPGKIVRLFYRLLTLFYLSMCLYKLSIKDIYSLHL